VDAIPILLSATPAAFNEDAKIDGEAAATANGAAACVKKSLLEIEFIEVSRLKVLLMDWRGRAGFPTCS